MSAVQIFDLEFLHEIAKRQVDFQTIIMFSCQLCFMRCELACWAVFGCHHLIPVQPVNCLRLLKARLMCSWSSSVSPSPLSRKLNMN